MKHITKLLSLTAAPCIAVLASCATSTTTSGPRAHSHGDLVHSHALTAQGVDHSHPTAKKTTVKVKNKKIVVPVKPAQQADIKPLGLKAIGHKHHTHVAPKTGVETVPC